MVRARFFINCKSQSKANSWMSLLFLSLFFGQSIAFANAFSLIKRPERLVACPPADNSRQVDVGANSKTEGWDMCWGSLDINAGRLEGVWRRGLICRGNLRLHNGDTYVGDFDNGDVNGSGVFKRADGIIIGGNFVNGRLNGRGIEKYPDGLTMMGSYIDGRRDGFWEIIRDNSTTYREYKDGNFIRNVDMPHGRVCGEEKDLDVCIKKHRERLRARGREELISKSEDPDPRMIPDNACPF
jgi:hypothetical protein